MYYKVYFDINNFHFWSGAKDRMDDATPEQREKIEERIYDVFATGDIPTDDDINDLVWFECDDIFYPKDEEEEDDEEDEENEDDETEEDDDE